MNTEKGSGVNERMPMWTRRKWAFLRDRLFKPLRRVGFYRWKMGLLPMHKSFRYSSLAMCAALFIAAQSKAAVNVSFSTNVPTALQQTFIADTTNQYLSTLTSSPFFQNTFSLIIKGKNPVFQPPAISSPIATATAVDQCMAYGFSQGMDSERYYNRRIIWNMQGSDLVNHTCGARIVGDTVTKADCQDLCAGIYTVIVSTIEQRWGYVYTPQGVQVVP